METINTTLLIVGGGPGGYVAGIRAGQLGIPAIVVEGANPGGTCLNIGCIPSKALIHAADEYHKAATYAAQESPLGISVESPKIDLERTVAWKDGIVKRLTGGVGALLKKQGVRVVHGWARVLDGKTVEVEADGQETVRIRCEHLLLASGSQAVELPFMPFGGPVISSTEALSQDSVPRRLVVVGAGYIGLELGTAYRKLGSQVTVVEAAERILPAYDADLVKPVAKSLERLGVELRLATSVLGIEGERVKVRDAS
jgi:dihydrolipoamide dehydrogenase